MWVTTTVKPHCLLTFLYSKYPLKTDSGVDLMVLLDLTHWVWEHCILKERKKKKKKVELVQ